MNSAASASDPFDRLARPVQKWIRDQGWTELRAVQALAVETILGGDADVIVSAATAGGKTESAFLPLLSDVIDRPSGQGGFDLVYIGPLKALITDQALRLEGMVAGTGLAVTPWHGDVGQGVKARARKAPSGVLLITPESLEAMFLRDGRDIHRLFAATRAVVIDELHTMLDSERGVHLRSLLTRLDVALGRRPRRVGLSATLGEMDMVRGYLNPDAPDTVARVEVEAAEAELKVQFRACIEPSQEAGGPEARRVIADHLFERMRGTRNLVFAGSRQNVEAYADRLARRCETEGLPQEFLPHHASLSAEARRAVEDRLRDGRLPLTAVCTSTLELGIDIGDVACVGQIGPPHSVASLRQRLGRSGRRAGAASVLRMYARLPHLTAKSDVLDRLRPDLLQGVAVLDLILRDRWCEPPTPGALHLSTLVHQVLAIVAERGGATAARLHGVLCGRGPFRAVDRDMFLDVLRDMGQAELLEQAGDGTLLLGRAGEGLTAQHHFYAVFQTPEEWQVLAAGRRLGTLPVTMALMPGMALIFGGRRWTIAGVDEAAKVLELKPGATGTPPTFGGEAGPVHRSIGMRMREVLERGDLPTYLDAVAVEALTAARAEHARHGAAGVLADGRGGSWLLPWAGSVEAMTLALALVTRGVEAEADGIFVHVPAPPATMLADHLPDLARDGLLAEDLEGLAVRSEKYHEYLSDGLVLRDALSDRIDLSTVAATAAGLCPA